MNDIALSDPTPKSDSEEVIHENTADALESGKIVTDKVQQEHEFTDTTLAEEEEEDIDEDLLALQQSNQPISYCVQGTKFWCTFWIFPILFVVVNAVAIPMFIVFDPEYALNRNGYYFDSFDEIDESDMNEQLDGLMRKNILAVAIIAFIDTLLLFIAKIHVSKDVNKLNDIEDNKADNDGKTHVFGTVARKFDKFFGFTRRPKTATLVGLLFNLTVIGLATSATAFSAWGYTSSTEGREVCNSNPKKPDLTSEEKIEGIPDGLQDWANMAMGRGHYYGGDNERKGFLHLSDGRTFFSGTLLNWTDADDVTHASRRYEKVLFSAGANGTLTTHKDVHRPQYGFSVLGENEENSDGFCLTYSSQPRHTDYYDSQLPSTPALCVLSGEDISGGFRNTTLIPADTETNKYRRNEAVTSSGGKFWYMVTWQYESRWGGTEDRTTVFYALDPTTMTVEQAANVTADEGGHGHHGYDYSLEDKCEKKLQLISLASLGVVLPFTLYALIKQRMGAAIVPLAFATCTIVVNFNTGIAEIMSMVIVLCTTVMLIRRKPKCFNREMMVHLHYTVMVFTFCIPVFDFEAGGPSVAVVALLGLVTAIVLNHPVLQVIGWVGGLGYALGFAVAAANPRSFGLYDGGDIILLIPVSIVVGFGVVAIGTLLKKYRAYIVYYSRRLWAMIRKVETNDIPEPSGPPSAADVKGDEDRTLIT